MMVIQKNYNRKIGCAYHLGINRLFTRGVFSNVSGEDSSKVYSNHDHEGGSAGER